MKRLGETDVQSEAASEGSGGAEPQQCWTADGDRFWIAPEDLLVTSAEERGTGVLTYGKATGSQAGFAAASLPVPLLKGDVLRLHATGVTDWKAVLLRLGAYVPAAPLPEVITFNYPTATASGYTPLDDAITRRSKSQLKAFTDWLEAHGQPKGYVGEVGWPKNDDKWHALAEAWYAAADDANLHVTNWSVGDWWRDEDPWQPYTFVTGAWTSTGSAPVVEAHPTTADRWRGVNLNIAEFGTGEVLPSNSGAFSNVNPGTYGQDYKYPDEDVYAYLHGRGVRVGRLAFRWERIQPALRGPLDATELGRLTAAVSAANAAGMKLVLNLHNYGRYWSGTDANTRTEWAFGDGLAAADLADVWSRLALAFQGNAGVLGFGLMNEPHDFEQDGALLWEQVSQAAVTAIRDAGSGKLILVPGYDWSSAAEWPEHHTRGSWIDDPSDNFAYEAHHYWDNTREGSYEESYAEEDIHAEHQCYGHQVVPPVLMRIMPLGDSLTGEPRAWRDPAYTQLTTAGFKGGDWIFVGAACDAYTGMPNEYHYHQGMSGWTMQGVLAKVDDWLTGSPADLVVLHIGANNIFSYQSQTSAELTSDWFDLVDKILAHSSNVRLLACTWGAVSSLVNPPNGFDRAETVVEVNNLIKAQIVGHTHYGTRLHLVEHIYTADDTRDGVHLSDEGYVKMAKPITTKLMDLYPPAPPVGVTDLMATAPAASLVTLNWSDAAGETSYTLERRPAGAGAWTEIEAGIPANSTNADDTTVAAMTAYEYRLVSVNAGGTTASNVAAVTTPAGVAGLAFIKGSHANGSGGPVSIARPAGAVAGTELYLGIFPGDNFTAPAPTSPDWTLVADATVTGDYAGFLYRRVAQAGDGATYSFPLAGWWNWQAVLGAVAGGDGVADTASGTNHWQEQTAPLTVTAPQDGLLLHFASGHFGAVTDDGGMTPKVTADNCALHSEGPVAAGDYTRRLSVQNVQLNASMLLALKPKP
ncbi:cellulase family glycosylhydrolase [Corallococcus aberystwythensis]|nr:cellulase family glycosylhydrolase [Corallococcus aberystwythensis]